MTPISTANPTRYAPARPTRPNFVEPFHRLWRTIAPSSPYRGARRRMRPGPARAAIATPMPVIAVHSGCSSGETMARSTNTYPSWSTSTASMKYWMFSVAAKPRPTIAA